MKHPLLVALCLSTLITGATAMPALHSSTPLLKSDGIPQAGGGFSEDAQQIAPHLCFNGKETMFADQTALFDTSAAKSFEQLEQTLHIHVGAKAGFGAFSASSETDYLHSVEDKDYSLSLNYYYIGKATMGVNYGFGADNVLNDTGKAIYNDPKNKKYFGVLCGDTYIKSYDKGAMLLMSMNIHFTSHDEKTQFTEDAGASLGSLASVSVQIEKTAKKYNLQGSVSIQAFQRGGEPNELANIIHSKDPSGKYYILTCDLQNMDACAHAASDLYDYAGNSFSQQFNFDGDTGKNLVVLGDGFAEHETVAALGLDMSDIPSLVTPEIQANRDYLANTLAENQYYQQKFHELLKGYPVAWDETSNVYKQSQLLAARADSNIDIVMGDTPETGGAACYSNLFMTDPDHNCDAVTQKIKQNVKPITADDLQFLDSTKFYYPLMPNFAATIYPNGSQGPSPYTLFTFDQDTLVSFSFSPTQMNVEVLRSNSGYSGPVYFSGKSTDSGASYTGPVWDDVHNFGNMTVYREINPFYFTAYQPTKK